MRKRNNGHRHYWVIPLFSLVGTCKFCNEVKDFGKLQKKEHKKVKVYHHYLPVEGRKRAKGIPLAGDGGSWDNGIKILEV